LGDELEVTPEIKDKWDLHWCARNVEFEKFLFTNLDLARLSNKMFFIWDGNHRLKAWYPYID
jgi:hypothetical protein